MENNIIIGEPKKIVKVSYEGKPKKRYRIMIQESGGTDQKFKTSNSFMIYDYKGNTSITQIKKRLFDKLKIIKND